MAAGKRRVDLSIPLNRRGVGREIEIPIPIYGGGMSYGSISEQVMLARAMAAKNGRPSSPPARAVIPFAQVPTKTTSSPRSPPACLACAKRPSNTPRSWSSSMRRAPNPVWAGTCWVIKRPPPSPNCARACPGSACFRPSPSTRSIRWRTTASTWIGSRPPTRKRWSR